MFSLWWEEKREGSQKGANVRHVTPCIGNPGGIGEVGGVSKGGARVAKGPCRNAEQEVEIVYAVFEMIANDVTKLEMSNEQIDVDGALDVPTCWYLSTTILITSMHDDKLSVTIVA